MKRFGFQPDVILVKTLTFELHPAPSSLKFVYNIVGGGGPNKLPVWERWEGLKAEMGFMYS